MLLKREFNLVAIKSITKLGDKYRIEIITDITEEENEELRKENMWGVDKVIEVLIDFNRPGSCEWLLTADIDGNAVVYDYSPTQYKKLLNMLREIKDKEIQ